MNCRIRDENGYLGLVALLVTLVIAVLLVYTFLGPKRSGGPGPETIPGRAIERGHDTECQANLNSIRQAIEVQKTQSETPPASVADIQVGVSDPSFFKCPVGKEDYMYDPQAGTIRCPHPGHGGY